MEIGTKIKYYRKSKGLTQKDLSEGICSQGMLSQIEKNKHTPNLILISKICERLEISIEELINYSTTELLLKKELKEKFETLFYERKYDELYKLIKLHHLNAYFYTKLDQQLITFYKALYYGYEEGNDFKAIELLEEALFLTYFENKRQLNYQEYIIINNMVIFLMKIGSFEEAFQYFDLIVEDINGNSKVENEPKLTIVFFNIANAYSKYGFYEKALHTANKGIEWANKTDIKTTIRLSYLYYEKAYNEKMLNHTNYLDSYKLAYYLAKNDKDEMLMKYIKAKINID